MGTRARTVHSLNGTWRIVPGSASEPSGAWRSTVPVPALVDLASPRYDWAAADYHWYRCTFTLSEEESSYSFALLRIDQAMFGTKVWLNGTLLGEDIACYTSQEYDATAALQRDGENELFVRVGRRDLLPPESAVGKDQERTTFIPGIWGDVALVLSGMPRVSNVQVIPRIGSSTAEVRVTVENRSAQSVRVRVASSVVEDRSRRRGAPTLELLRTVPAGSQRVVSFAHTLRDLRLWSPKSPFLYNHLVRLESGGRPMDEIRTRFGMREFRATRSGFYLNGKRIFLRGGNIAFHRFLSDADRGTLPWDIGWIRRVLIDIPKRHNFNFFRNHLGQMYNRWYDIADEDGMLLQNEWQFWTVGGTKEQITKEFTRWLQDNWNHPSIVIWDPLNESSDETVQREIVPAMKKLDPTRPWESVDFLEEHPYIYSLGPVLIDRRLGYSRSLREVERSRRPTMLNEFLWWWLDKAGKPTSLTEEVVQRWIGTRATRDELLEYQCFLARELVELFRRMGVDAIQPFAYLTCNEGPTSHWFLGPISELQAKPVLGALREAFAPFGVSIELWDRHFYPDEKRAVRIFLFNDRPERTSGKLRVGVLRPSGRWVWRQETMQFVRGSSTKKVRAVVRMPRATGEYRICAELVRGGKVGARSVKPAFVLREELSSAKQGGAVVLLGGTPELRRFFRELGLKVEGLTSSALSEPGAIIVNGAAVRSNEFAKSRKMLSQSVRAGSTLIVLEPEYGIRGEKEIELFDGVGLSVKWREDADKGGYDSHVFVEDLNHPIWKGINPAHLRFFNGGYGGEIVSQHTVLPLGEHRVLARCGLGLRVIAAAEMSVGKGKVVLFRLQVRGRLWHGKRESLLYDRRQDPVARMLLRNLVGYGA